MAALHILIDDPADGPTNMARDEHLLFSETHRPAALRLYGWAPPTISLGYFQRYDDVAQLPAPLRDLAVVRRPTGGGAILHDREITYCLVVDDSLPIARRAPSALYSLVHEAWRDVLADDGVATEVAPERLAFPSPRSGPFFCFERPGRTDLLLGGSKVLGSAQRRVPGRVLQHGSLILDSRFVDHPGAHLNAPAPARVGRWLDAFAQRVAAALTLSPRCSAWDATLADDVERRRARYASDEWMRKR